MTGVVLSAAVGAGLVLASGAGPAEAAPSTWTQRVVCPTSGLPVTLSGSEHLRHLGSGPAAVWTVSETVTAVAPATGPRTFDLAYVGRSASGAGGTVVTGRSLEMAPGGDPDVVTGTAYLAPDGLLGRFTGSALSVCAAMGG